MDRNLHIASKDTRLSVAYFWNDGIFINPSGLGGTPGQAYDYPLGNKNLSIIDTHTFNSRVINEAVYGFNWSQRDIQAYGKGVLLADVGMKRYNSSPSFQSCPALVSVMARLVNLGMAEILGVI